MSVIYKDFKEYLDKNYYDLLFNNVNKYFKNKKERLKLGTDLVPYPNDSKLTEISIMGVSFNSTTINDEIDFHLAICGSVEVYGKVKDYYKNKTFDTDEVEIWFGVSIKAILKTG